MVIINLVTGHEDADRVTVAFLVAVAALEKGKQVTMFLTKEAVRIGLPGYADAIETAGAPPVSRLFAQFAEQGRRASGLPDLLRSPQARRRRARGQRAPRRGDAAVGADRRRARDRLQLLTAARRRSGAASSVRRSPS